MMYKIKTGSIRLNNITGYLSRNAARFPDKPAILHPRVVSFSELDREVDRFAAGLSSAGISKGTRTILLVSAGPEFFIICFALFRIGAIPVMIDPGMGVRAMAKALAGSGATAFIGVPRSHVLRFLYPRCFNGVKTWIHIGKTIIPGSSSISLLTAYNKPPGLQCTMDPEETAAIFFTSGSTGPPKGVIYRAGMLDAQVKMMEEHFRYTPEDIDLCTFPLLGLFVICLGSSLVIADMDPVRPAMLDPEKLISNLNLYKCTQMFGSPMILDRLVRHASMRPVKLVSLRRIISAGAPVPLELMKSFLKLSGGQAEIHTPYGATEALPVTDITAGELFKENSGGSDYSGGICVGYPLPGISLKIIGITDGPIVSWTEAVLCKDGEVGEIAVKGAWVTAGYVNNTGADSLSKIKESRGGDLWHRMGDLGRIDEKGLLWFYGRKAHRVVLPGRILFTIPAEAIFNRHPGVRSSALVGIPAETKGIREPVIWIQPESWIRKKQLPVLKKELKEISSKNELTSSIKHILFHKDFPVDPRHNAKIFREKLASLAERRLR